MKIRPVCDQDITTIHRLGENVDEFHTSDQAPNFWPETILRACVDKEDVNFLVAVSGNEIVGFVIVNLNRSLSKALIENIFVAPEFRGQGIGSRLVRSAIDTVKSGGYQFISVLTPPDDEAAIRAYEAAGFSKGETFLWLDVA